MDTLTPKQPKCLRSDCVDTLPSRCWSEEQAPTLQPQFATCSFVIELEDNAQNRLVEAHHDATNNHVNYYYDGLNRQILRYVTVDPYGLHSWDNPPDYPPFSQEHFQAAENYFSDLSGAALGARHYFQQRGNRIGALYALGASGLFALGADFAHLLATLTPPHHQTLPPPPNNQPPAEKKNDQEPKEKEPPASGRTGGGGGGGEGSISGSPNSGSPFSGAPPSVTFYVTGIANTQIGSPAYNNFVANNPGAITVQGAVPGVPANTAFGGTVIGKRAPKIYKKK